MNKEGLAKRLMVKAQAEADLSHRTVEQQLDYWTEVGSCVSPYVDDSALLGIKNGFMRIQVVPVVDTRLTMADVRNDLSRKQRDGSLAARVTKAPFYFQPSRQRPGLLERVDRQNGNIEIGFFRDGEFVHED